MGSMLPLLHAAQAPSGFAFDLLAPVAVAALAGFLIPFAAVRRSRRRFRRAAVALAVALALLPSILPFDHLVAHASAEMPAHEAHCHGSPASCSDAPVSAGPGQLLASAPLLVVPALVLVFCAFVAVRLSGRDPRPDLRPPLALAAA